MRGGSDLGCFPTGRHYPGIAHLLKVTAAGLAEDFDGETPIKELPMVCIDTETTGRDPQVDRIVEIACVIYRNGRVEQSLNWLVNPEMPMPKEAFDVHGIGDDMLKDQPTFAQIAGDVLTALRGAIPVAYNASFDRGFVVAELERAGVVQSEPVPAVRRRVDWIDPLTWARELQKQEKSKALSEVCARLGIEIGQAHRANDDAEAALNVLLHFLSDARVPRSYGAFITEQRRLAQEQEDQRMRWRGR